MVLRSLCVFSFGLIILFSGSLQAEEVDRGQLLYENHCGECHASDVHERVNRKVNSLVELSRVVIHWQYHLKLDWSFDEVRQVMRYLNQRYYNIDKRP